MTIIVQPIAADIAHRVRVTRTDPIYGNPHSVAVSTADEHGYGPCRQCLRRFRAGERRILFLHNPFGAEFGDYAGPIFIHEDACDSFDQVDILPEEIVDLPLLARGYDAGGHLVAEAQPPSGKIEAPLRALLDREGVAVVHLRNREAKCFVAEVRSAWS